MASSNNLFASSRSKLKRAISEAKKQVKHARGIPAQVDIEGDTLPESLLEIGWSAFSGCTSLVSLRIPSKVKRLANYTFSNCVNLKRVSLPKGIKLDEDCLPKSVNPRYY